jgi:hypothetical protein
LAYPGWQVSIDGQPADWQTLEGMYRGVELPAGKHTLLWEYRPASQRWGYAISGATCLVIVALGGFRWRTSRPSHQFKA